MCPSCLLRILNLLIVRGHVVIKVNLCTKIQITELEEKSVTRFIKCNVKKKSYSIMLYFYASVFLVEGKVSGLAEDDMNNKLQMMVTTVYTMRAAIGNLKDDYNALKTNITKLSNMTRYQEFNTNIETLST